jgi:hypothetical protein
LAGIASGHANKVLGPVPVKALGRITLSALLGVLALKLVVVVDEQQAATSAADGNARTSTAIERH